MLLAFNSLFEAWKFNDKWQCFAPSRSANVKKNSVFSLVVARPVSSSSCQILWVKLGALQVLPHHILQNELFKVWRCRYSPDIRFFFRSSKGYFSHLYILMFENPSGWCWCLFSIVFLHSSAHRALKVCRRYFSQTAIAGQKNTFFKASRFSLARICHLMTLENSKASHTNYLRKPV